MHRPCQIIRFRTRNSAYRFMWVTGQRLGVLLCESGTLGGQAFQFPVLPFQEQAWTGQQVVIEDEDARKGLDEAGLFDRPARLCLETTEVVWTDRPEDVHRAPVEAPHEALTGLLAAV